MDLFVSHASEDKNEIVRPLVKKLKNSGVQLWYDEHSLKAGDSLRRSIDKGIRECKGGLVILSKSFFSKEWPQRELDALFNAEINGKVKIIPIWHGVNSQDIANFSAFLVDRVAINSKEGLDYVVQKILEAFPVEKETVYTNKTLRDLLLSYINYSDAAANSFAEGCIYRYSRFNAIRSDYAQFSDWITSDLSEEEWANGLPESVEQKLNQLQSELINKYNFSENVYLQLVEPRAKDFTDSVSGAIRFWASGVLSEKESAELVLELDLDELDENYILFDIPNYELSAEQHQIVTLAMVAYGCGFEDDYSQYTKICNKLE